MPGERLIFKNFCGKTWQEEQESENIYSRRTPPTAIVCPASHSPSGLCSSSAGQGPSHRLTCTMSNDKASLHSNGHGAPMSPHQELVLLFKISHNDRIDWEGTTSYFPRTLTSVTHTPRAHTPGQQLSKLGRIQASVSSRQAWVSYKPDHRHAGHLLGCDHFCTKWHLPLVRGPLSPTGEPGENHREHILSSSVYHWRRFPSARRWHVRRHRHHRGLARTARRFGRWGTVWAGRWRHLGWLRCRQLQGQTVGRRAQAVGCGSQRRENKCTSLDG